MQKLNFIIMNPLRQLRNERSLFKLEVLNSLPSVFQAVEWRARIKLRCCTAADKNRKPSILLFQKANYAHKNYHIFRKLDLSDV